MTSTLDPETTPWEVLFKARGGLTGKQVEALSILSNRGHILVEDIAISLCTSPGGAGRVVANLCRKGLAYEDYIGGGTTKNHVTLSDKGRTFVTEHGIPT